MGAVLPLVACHNTEVRRGRVDIHRDQAIVERFNRTLAEQLFGYQYAQEMLLPEGERSVEWVTRLPAVVAALNNEPTRLIGKKPQDAIESKSVVQKPSAVVPGRAVGLLEERLSSDADLRYIHQPGEQEGGRRRATDPIWSLEVLEQERAIVRPGEPVVYYLRDGPK